ncbi:Isotrichodermin C-15 hydroxylase [Fusarium tjaetaba]|uniref:Isotrichodermin C-15 hydroxylase n=1 Tax=Fusarium tjaetaba TaxID=1567544 RepID=A0A8H5R0N7_9HYPO|nr:Isotrichodermin C-15 hydroxylase [Fusarium tjaetaba]KAF5624098.1 Isotrichodermin C-15 hydroxylase [Fusarium tjaetaba]
MHRNDPTTQYIEHDDDEEWPFGMEHWILPLFLFFLYITIGSYISTPYDSVCIDRGPLPIQNFEKWAPKLDDIKINIQNIIQEQNNKETSRTLDAIYIPVDIATSLQKENQQLKQAIGCKFDDERLLQIAKESVEEKLQSYPENSLFREELIAVRAYALLSRLQELQEARNEIWKKLNGQFRQDLNKITYSVCYASAQLEDLAREAKTFNKPTLRQLQKVSVATYVLCQESRSDARTLDELVDQLGVRLSLVETAINRLGGLRDTFEGKHALTKLWRYLMVNLTEEELDSYEAERMMIGRNMIEMLDGGVVLPELAS